MELFHQSLKRSQKLVRLTLKINGNYLKYFKKILHLPFNKERKIIILSIGPSLIKKIKGLFCKVNGVFCKVHRWNHPKEIRMFNVYRQTKRLQEMVVTHTGPRHELSISVQLTTKPDHKPGACLPDHVVDFNPKCRIRNMPR